MEGDGAAVVAPEHVYWGRSRCRRGWCSGQEKVELERRRAVKESQEKVMEMALGWCWRSKTTRESFAHMQIGRRALPGMT